MEGVEFWAYVDFHLLVDPIVHDQAVRQPNAMGLHRMTSNVGIVSHIGVVEVSNSLLTAAVQHRSVDGRRVDNGIHPEEP